MATSNDDDNERDFKFVDTEQWRKHMENAVKELHEKVDILTSNVSAALTIHASNSTGISSNATEIANNTRITLDLKESLDAFQTRAMPAIEVTETMQRGATAVGKTIEFVAKWGHRVWRVVIFIGGCWIAFQIIFRGGSWSDALKAFFTAQH